MRSTKSFFNSTVFFKTLRRCWPLWSTYLALFTIIYSTAASSNASTFTHYGYMNEDSFYSISLTFGTVFIFITCCLSAMLVYSWMYNARSASGYSSLPIKRSGLFISSALAGIAPLLAANLISLFIAWLFGIGGGLNLIIPLLKSFAVLSFMCILFYGIASFCAVLTGHVFILPAIYVIFNFVAVVVEQIIYFVMEMFVYGATTGSSLMFPFSPMVKIFSYNALELTDSCGIIVNLAVYAAVGAVLTVLAVLIVRRRKMETASDVVAIRVLKPVFKYCLCFGCALTIGLLLYIIIFNFGRLNKNYASLALGAMMVIGGFIGYFTAEMLMKKSFRVFKKSWKGFIAAFAVIAAFIIVLDFDLLGFEKHIPDLDRVESVTVSVSGYDTKFTSSADIAELEAIHRLIIQNKVYSEKRVNSYYEYDNSNEDYMNNLYPRTLYINYTLKNGHTLRREYSLILSDDPISGELLELLNKPSSVRSRLYVDLDKLFIAYVNGSIPKELTEVEKEVYLAAEGSQDYDLPSSSDAAFRTDHIDYTFDAEEAKKLYTEGILADIDEGNIGTISFYFEDYNRTYSDNEFWITIDFEMRENTLELPDRTESYYYGSVYVYPTEESVNTLRVLSEFGADIGALEDKVK